MQNIINQIQAGTINTADLLDALVVYDNDNVNSINTALDHIETLEGETTLNQLCIAELKAKLACTVKFEARIQALSTTVVSYQAELILLREENKLAKQHANENKSLKKNKAKQVKASQARETRINTLEAEAKMYRAEILKQNSDIARLRMTGQKNIGNYSFSIFPTHVDATDNGKVSKRVAIVVFNNEGCMKIIRMSDNDEILQPASHNFEFNDEQTAFIERACNVIKADDHQFTPRVLQMFN